MKIDSQTVLSKLGPRGESAGTLEQTERARSSFGEVLRSITAELSRDPAEALRLRGASITDKKFRELFSLQTSLSRHHLTVELCSKVAEGISATVRKLQQGS